MTKSKERYVQEIKILHESISHWNPTAAGVIKDVFKLKSVPDKYQVLSMLRIRKDAWYKKLDIVIWVAGNEQKGWTEKELGFPTTPMPLLPELKKIDKSFTGQTGDYVCIVEGQLMRFGIERKAMEDMYGTMFGKSPSGEPTRMRLYREFERGWNVFDQMYVFVECDESTFMDYTPTRRRMKSETCAAFEKRNARPSASVASRQASIKSIQARGVHVIFHTDRLAAASSVGELLRQWVLSHYLGIIHGDKTNA